MPYTSKFDSVASTRGTGQIIWRTQALSRWLFCTATTLRTNGRARSMAMTSRTRWASVNMCAT
eukprot:4895543-Prorocentrum_lima.AAC.1